MLNFLYFSPILPFLAKLLASQAFRDYSIIKELLEIRPEKGDPWVLEWKEEFAGTLLFTN